MRLDAITALSREGEHYAHSFQTINGNPCRVMDAAPATLRDLLQHSQQFADLDYLVFGEERMSYAQAYAEIARLAQAPVNDYGIGKGERVQRLLPLVDMLDCRLIAVRCAEFEHPRLRHYPAVVAARVAARVAGKMSQLPEPELAADVDGLIFFTSGSTGHPKGVVSSHRAAIHAIMSWDFDVAIACHRFGLQRPDESWSTRFKFLVAVPLFHVAGSHMSMIAALYRGREIHLMYKWDVMAALDIIEQEQITHFVAAPSMTGDLVKAAEQHQRSLTSLAQVGGGSPRPSQQVKDIDRVFKKAAPTPAEA